MGITIDKPLTTGVIAGYWEIAEMHYNVMSNEKALKMAGWLDQAARDAGMAPLQYREFSVPDGFPAELTDGVISAGYAMLATMPDWSTE